MNMRMLTIFAFGIFAIMLLNGLEGPADVERKLDLALYCELVKQGRETNMELGWPDYNENYDEVCDV